MKILFIHPSTELYGADKILLYILKILNKEEHNITVLVPKTGVLLDYIKQISLNIKIVVDERMPIAHSKLGIKGYFSIPKKIHEIEKLFKKESFDCVYCNTLAVVLLLYTKWAKNRIIHVHEIIENPVLNLAFSVLLRLRTKNVICVSNKVKKNLLFSKKYKVIHNGIPDISGHIIKNEIKERIIFVLPGRYMPKKGQWFLIDALEKMQKEYLSKIHISLYGSAPPNRPELQTQLQNIINERKLQTIISLHSFERDISQIYKQANVILVPSIMADPFPTTVLEALMFSRPVIATNHGGASEILEKEYSILISPNDTEAFANAIQFFVDNSTLIQQMSEKARNKYEENLTEDKFAECFIQYFNKIKVGR